MSRAFFFGQRSHSKCFLEVRPLLPYFPRVNDERFHRGIAEFNRRYFFEAHDILEDLWHEYREDDRLFLQGLIQIAVGCHHLENRNFKGAQSQFTKALSKLEPYLPNHQHILVEPLLKSVERCLEVIEEAERESSVAIDESLLPTIKYTSPTAA